MNGVNAKSLANKPIRYNCYECNTFLAMNKGVRGMGSLTLEGSEKDSRWFSHGMVVGTCAPCWADCLPAGALVRAVLQAKSARCKVLMLLSVLCHVDVRCCRCRWRMMGGVDGGYKCIFRAFMEEFQTRIPG